MFHGPQGKRSRLASVPRYSAPRIREENRRQLCLPQQAAQPQPLMARTQSLPAHQPDPTQISLTRLLDRLQTALLSSDADPKLRTSSFERTKVGAVGNLAVSPSTMGSSD